MPLRPRGLISKEPLAEGTSVRETEIRAMLHEQFHDACVVGQNIIRPGLDRPQDAGVEILDFVLHAMLASALTEDKLFGPVRLRLDTRCCGSCCAAGRRKVRQQVQAHGARVCAGNVA